MRTSGISKMRGLGLTLSVVGLVAAGLIAVVPDLDAAGQRRFGRGMRGPGGPGGSGRGGAMMMGLRQLDLTDAQRAAMRDIMEGHRERLDALRERSAPIREALRGAATATPVDESLIRHLSAQLAEVQADGAVLHANIQSEVFAVLTPEQQTEARELRAERERRMEERRARRANR